MKCIAEIAETISIIDITLVSGEIGRRRDLIVIYFPDTGGSTAMPLADFYELYKKEHPDIAIKEAFESFIGSFKLTPEITAIIVALIVTIGLVLSRWLGPWSRKK